MDYFGRMVKGWSGDSIVFMTPCATLINQQNFSELLGDNKPNFFYTIHGSKNAIIYERIITAFFIWRVLQKETNWSHNVHVLLESGSEDKPVVKHTPFSGNSGAITLYLSLLSAYYQKPISQEVAATALLEVSDYSKIKNFCHQCLSKEIEKKPKETFSKNRIGPINGLEHKVSAAIKSGVKKLILSTKQKEDYEKNVPQEIREKLTVYYVKDVEELERLFWAGEFS